MKIKFHDFLTMVQKVMNGQNIQEHRRMDMSDAFPRCSTPVSDPPGGPGPRLDDQYADLPGHMEDSSDSSDLYLAWKKRLLYPRTCNIKIRGMESRQSFKDSSIISGHFSESPAQVFSSIYQRPVENKPTLYQMCYPYNVQGFFQPQMVYPAPMACPCQKPMCFAMPVQMQPFAAHPLQMVQPMQHQSSHFPPPPPPMRHMYYDYAAFMPHPQQSSYYSSVGGYGNPGNGAFMVPLMMAGKV